MLERLTGSLRGAFFHAMERAGWVPVAVLKVANDTIAASYRHTVEVSRELGRQELFDRPAAYVGKVRFRDIAE